MPTKASVPDASVPDACLPMPNMLAYIPSATATSAAAHESYRLPLSLRLAPFRYLHRYIVETLLPYFTFRYFRTKAGNGFDEHCPFFSLSFFTLFMRCVSCL
jgi:hypothetical protein